MAIDPKQLGNLPIPALPTCWQEVLCYGICIDSRKVQKGDLFFALPGQMTDGRLFIRDVLRDGASAVLVEADGFNASQYTDLKSPIMAVAGLSDLVGEIAAAFYDLPANILRMVAVTGTNGKTSISHYLTQLFSALEEPTWVIGTLGAGFLSDQALQPLINTTPDACTLQTQLYQAVCQQAETCVMEVSSSALAQGRVRGIEFDSAIFTNLTRDHLNEHGTMDQYFEVKKSLFTEYGIRRAIINVDDPYGALLFESLPLTLEKMSYGVQNSQANLKIEACVWHDPFYHVNINTPWGKGEFRTRLLGEFNLSNLLAVIATVVGEGFSLSDVLPRIELLEPVAGRFMRIEGQPIIIDYAHTPDALENALITLTHLAKGKICCVFGCGGDRDAGKRALMGEIADQFADRIVLTNDNPRTERPLDIINSIQEGITNRQKVIVEPDREQAILTALHDAEADDWVLIAGKGHETYQEIGNQRFPFSDEAIVKKALARRQHD